MVKGKKIINWEQDFFVHDGTVSAVKSAELISDRKSSERAEEFKYLGTTSTNQNSFQEEIKLNYRQGTVTIFRCRIFCLPTSYPKI